MYVLFIVVTFLSCEIHNSQASKKKTTYEIKGVGVNCELKIN